MKNLWRCNCADKITKQNHHFQNEKNSFRKDFLFSKRLSASFRLIILTCTCMRAQLPSGNAELMIEKKCRARVRRKRAFVQPRGIPPDHHTLKLHRARCTRMRTLAARILLCVCARSHAHTNGLHECGRLRAPTDTCTRKERACTHECVRARQTIQIIIFITENGLAFQPEIWDQFWARKSSYANLASQGIHVRAPRPF